MAYGWWLWWGGELPNILYFKFSRLHFILFEIWRLIQTYYFETIALYIILIYAFAFFTSAMLLRRVPVIITHLTGFLSSWNTHDYLYCLFFQNFFILSLKTLFFSSVHLGLCFFPPEYILFVSVSVWSVC